MGCAGSKPHHLLSSSISNHHHHHHHVNSPQKGFILFNANTIEYLKANEEEIKSKLIQRSKQKLIKSNGVGSHVSSKSLFGTTKAKHLLTNNTTTSSLPNGKATLTTTSTDEPTTTAPVAESTTTPVPAPAEAEVATETPVVENGTTVAPAVVPTQPPVTNGTLSTKANANEFKENAIENAVNYVLKYAINDFDIENFKSSNHLSMKQIRKDIMKKNHSEVTQSKQQHQQQQQQQNTTTSTTATTATATTTPAVVNTSINSSATLNTSTFNYGTLKNSESTFYKLALNTAIDEFGSFIQENFIVINEFKTKSSTSLNKQEENGQESGTTGDKQPNENVKANTDEEDALKLKEAIELARQNFYKGKMSMVCASKKGGYVVKEVKESANDLAKPELTTTSTTTEQETTTATEPTLAEDNTNEPKPVATLSDSPITPENLNKAKTVTILDPQTNQKSKVAISSKINIEDVDISATFKIIDTNQSAELTSESATAAAVPAEQPVEQTAPVADTSISELTANAEKVQKPSKKRSLLRLSKKESKSDTKAAVAAAETKAVEPEPAKVAEVEQPKPTAVFSVEQLSEMRNDFVSIVKETLESIDFYTKQVNTFNTSRVEVLVAEATKEETVVEEVKTSSEVVEEPIKQGVEEVVKQEGDQVVQEEVAKSEQQQPEVEQFKEEVKPVEEEKKEVEETVKEVVAEVPSTETVQFVFDFDKYFTLFKETIEKLTKLNEQVKTFNDVDYELLGEKSIECNLKELVEKFKVDFKSLQECQSNVKLNDEQLTEKSTQFFGFVEQVYNLVCVEFPARFFEAKVCEKPTTDSPATITNGTQKKSKSKLRSTPSWLKGKSKQQSTEKKNEEPETKPAENTTPDSLTPKSKKEKKKMEALNNGGKKSSPFKKIIDIKKEIAISILNVGEVLAKTIDYYSLSSSNTKEADLKELIKISEQQAAITKQNNGTEPIAEETAPTTSAAAASTEVAPTNESVEVTKTPPPVEATTTTTTDVELQATEVEEVVVEEKKTVEVVEVEHTTVTKVDKEPVVVSVVSSGDELHVNTEENNEAVNKEKEPTSEQQTTQQPSSSASSLSSPSLSTSSSISASAIMNAASQSTEPSQVISEVLIGTTENMASEVTSESFPVISTDRVLNGDETTTTNDMVRVNGVHDTDKKECMNKVQDNNEEHLESVEQAKHSQNEVNDGQVLRKDISFLVKEIIENQSELNREQLNLNSDDLLKSDESEKNKFSSESSSDILSSNNEESVEKRESNLEDEALIESERKATTDRFVATVIENAAQRLSQELSANSNAGDVVFRNGGSSGGSKRMSLDEELMYQLEDVDKKVKYMNETCSENEDGDDDDDDEFNRRFDDLNNEELNELDNDERLFHPRTPAKIKNDVRQQRSNELQEEIKQISSVIQDLVQTINVKQQSSSSVVNGEIVLDKYTLNDDLDSDMVKSTSSSSAASKKASNGSKRDSISSISSSSNIPRKILTKQKATEAADHLAETPKTNESFKSICSPNISDLVSNENSFNDTPKLNKSTSSKHSKKFRSKLPVKK